MTVQALEFFRKLKKFAPKEDTKHFDVVEQALEKQIPKKPIEVEPHATNDIDVWVTCKCGATILINKDYKRCYCWKCGQLIKLPQPYKKDHNGEVTEMVEEGAE